MSAKPGKKNLIEVQVYQVICKSITVVLEVDDEEMTDAYNGEKYFDGDWETLRGRAVTVASDNKEAFNKVGYDDEVPRDYMEWGSRWTDDGLGTDDNDDLINADSSALPNSILGYRPEGSFKLRKKT
jgi:hypothetical protein